LRIFFPKPELAATLVHVGFRHNDLPGALSAITPVIAHASFNVLTSLLRKKNSNQNTWEALLEYRGADVVPQPTPGQKKDVFQAFLVDWVVSKFTEAARVFDMDRIKQSELCITVPEYPRAGHTYEVTIRDKLVAHKSVAPRQQQETFKDRSTLLEERLQATATSNESQYSEARKALICVVAENARAKPRVFLSFPHKAKEHGAVLRDVLERDGYLVDEYQLPRGEIIVKEVIAKIGACDVFVGIWHHDSQRDKCTVSPWMPFEYGIALAFGRQCVMVHSKELDSSVWQRISPEIAHASYSDVRFESETIPIIVNKVRDVAPVRNTSSG